MASVERSEPEEVWAHDPSTNLAVVVEAVEVASALRSLSSNPKMDAEEWRNRWSCLW